MLNFKNGQIDLGAADVDYIRFGSGEKALVMLPGLGDGLHTVKGTAAFMALLYRDFARHYTVYAFSRKNKLSNGYSTQNMARDVKDCMDILGIEKAHIMGVSMGGMIAQHLAADYPECVDKLVLVVTCPCSNPLLTSSVSLWMAQARDKDHSALMDSNLRLIYSDSYYRKNHWLTPLIGMVTKPKSYERFLIMAEACLNHKALDKLSLIQAPTLIIGGEKDKTLGPDASRELNRFIIGSELYLYPNGYHGLYEEEKSFNTKVLEFLN